MSDETIKIPPRPGKLASAASRFPVWFYRLGLSRLLGKRFLMIEHTGRNSGMTRRTVLEVIRYSRSEDVFFVVSAWGERSDWYRNINKTPNVRLHSGGRVVDALAERLPISAAEGELRSYARRYPRAMKIIIDRLGYQVELDERGFSRLASVLPVVAIQPFADS